MDGSQEIGPARWRQCGKLVHAVRAGTQEKKFYDESVKAMRAQLRAEFEALLLEDYPYAQTKDAEQMLWKTVFYTVIEEFRRRIKAATAQGQKGSEPLRKTTSVFVKFLREATTFYALLTVKLQAAFGQLGFALNFPGLNDLAGASERSVIPEFKTSLDCRISIYRCLICLGDLARYEEMVVKDANSKKDWSRAEQYYYQAVDVFPEGGNSFNQLAVLATYNEAHLQAVCHYFRSLAVAHPFQVARENLLLLFDQARAKHKRLPPSQATTATPGKVQGRGRGNAAQKPKVPIAQLLPVLAIRFAHAHGVLFCKINLDSFNDILECAFADLDNLLCRPPVARGGNGEARRSDAIVMQLTIMCLFAAWNADYSPPGRPAGYSETLQSAEVKRHVRTLTFGLAARLAFAAACVGDVGMLHAGALLTSPLLPPLNVFLQWMATQEDMFRSDDVDLAEAKERASFWSSLCKVLLLMPSPTEAPSTTALPEDWQLRAFGPLSAAHQHLEFQLPRAEKDDGELRLQRILCALKGVADMLPQQTMEGPAPSLSPQRQEEQAAAAGFQRAVLRMFGAHDRAPVPTPVPQHEDFQMHEDAIPGVDGGQAEDAHHQADKPVQHQDIPARPQEADVDDDMEEDEDEERILYNPTQPPPKESAEGQEGHTSLQGDTAERSGPEQRIQATEPIQAPEPLLPQEAEHPEAGHLDILDQLMADGAIQDLQPSNTDGLPAGHARREGAFSPLSVYGAAPPQPTTLAAGAAPAAAEAASNAAHLPRDLSDANLGLLEVPDEREEEGQLEQPQNEGPDLMQSLQEGPAQQQPLSFGTPLSAAEYGQSALQTSERVPAGQYNSLQGLQQPTISQQLPQQRLYSGPGTVAPPPSALPDPGDLSFAQAVGQYSAAAGGQSQPSERFAQSAAAYHDLLGLHEKPDASLAKPAAQLAQQQPGWWPSEGMANQIAVPDNSTGLNSWQTLTDNRQGGGADDSTAAGHTIAPAAGPSGLPGSNARSFMREGESAGGAGGFLGRDLFANQRSELSRGASPAPMWEMPGQAHPANALGLQQQTLGSFPGNLQGPYGASTVPSAYEGAAGGFYINRDKQPQVPVTPKLGGFYQRDSRDLEAQLLAQALAARTGQLESSQPAMSQPSSASSALQHSAQGRNPPQPQSTSGLGGMSNVSDGMRQQGNSLQPPAVHSTAQHCAAGGNHAAQVPLQPGPRAAGRPLPSMPGDFGPLSGQPGQLHGRLLGSGLPQLPQPALWPTQPHQFGQQGGYNLFSGSLASSTGVSSGLPGMGMPDLSAAGQGYHAYPGYSGQYGAPNAGGGYQSAYGLQNGAVHLGSGQPTAQQGFVGLSNLQLQQRLALLQETHGTGPGVQGLQASNAASLYGQPAQQPAKPEIGSFSWLDAFQARQDVLRAQAAGAAAPNAFPFPGASGDAAIRLGNPHEPWRAH